MRPHIELVHDDDLIAHEARLPGGIGDVSEQRLSTDEETGGATTKLVFDSRWSRPPGWTAGDVEWFVLSGTVIVGDRVLRDGAYVRVPAGLCCPALDVDAGTVIIQFRDGGYAFTESSRNRAAFVRVGLHTLSGAHGEVTIVDSDTQPWQPDVYSEGCERHSVLRSKVLHQDPWPDWQQRRGQSTTLVEYPAGWRDELYEHELHATEGYVLMGSGEYNFGELVPGRYFHRPAGVRHGDLTVDPASPLVMLVRRGGFPRHLSTASPTFTLHATALTYDPDDPAEAPGVVGLPLRSASTGVFSSPIR